MIADPDTAPPRADLTFLRHRAKPRRPAAASAAAAPIDYTHHSTAKKQPPAPATGGARPKIDFSRPDRRPSASPAAAAPPPAAASPPSAPSPTSSRPGSSSLDLSGGAASSSGGIDYRRPDRSTPGGTPHLSGGTLDLSGDVAPPPPAPARRRPAAPPLPRRDGPRVTGHDQYLLGRTAPSVTLTRVQSGVGHLTVQAVCSSDVGDLRLGALYQFRSGGTSTVQLAGGNRFAPSSRRPVLVASHDEYEELGIDLRQIRDIERIGVYAFSESRTPLRWGGTLIVTTFGGARIELPLETLEPAAVAVLVSFYNVAGELVVRTEMEPIDGDIREAARAYGYDRITWRDDRSPID